MASPILLDATPSKDIYRSIIADYSLETGICELIDNAVDVWSRGEKATPLQVSILVDTDQQSLMIEDNAGGVGRMDLVYLVKPGASSIADDATSIGVFGVGCKRGPIALAQRIDIHTHRSGDDCFRISYDDDWVNSDDWTVQATVANSCLEGRTRIELSRLRAKIKDDEIAILRRHIGRTYARFLNAGECEVTVNHTRVLPQLFTDWAFPPSYEPHEQEILFQTERGELVAIRMTVGLRHNREAEDEYGVYVYCNRRLVISGLKTLEVGFFPGGAGKEHHDVSLVRAILEFDGTAREMPWNSSKTAINYQHRVFRHVQSWLYNALKKYGSLSRALKSDWDTEVFSHPTGQIVKGEPSFDDKPVRTFSLPKHPTKQTYEHEMSEVNAEISAEKPWARGLYEGVVAAHLISRSHLTERWRFALVVLDSTLEIGMKDFLVNETIEGVSDARLLQIFSDRKQVFDEVLKLKPDLVSEAERKKLEFYYRLRCKLVHERSTADIKEDQVADYRNLIQRVLKDLFRIRFVDSNRR